MLVSLGKVAFQENCTLDWTNRHQAVKRTLLIEKVLPSWTENTYATSPPAFFLQQRRTRLNYVVTSKTDQTNFSPYCKEWEWGRGRQICFLHILNHTFFLRGTTKFRLKTKRKKIEREKRDRITKSSACIQPSSAAACEVILSCQLNDFSRALSHTDFPSLYVTQGRAPLLVYWSSPGHP